MVRARRLNELKGLARFTDWFDSQRRKQAEFLVHQLCPWSLIREIAVVNAQMRDRVDAIQTTFPAPQRKMVKIEPSWYY
jgi:hypothetical protein